MIKKMNYLLGASFLMTSPYLSGEPSCQDFTIICNGCGCELSFPECSIDHHCSSYSKESNPCSHPSYCDQEYEGKLFVSGDVLYWFAKENDLVYLHL